MEKGIRQIRREARQRRGRSAQDEKGKEEPRGGSVRNRVYKAGQLDVHYGVVEKKKAGNHEVGM
jgi:hypothetical protein